MTIPHVLDGPIPQSPLILGKGPSIERINTINLGQYDVISLNQACVFGSKFAHFIDYEPFIDSAPVRNVWMPAVPHWRETPNSGPLTDYLKHDPRLRRLHALNMLYSYDLSTTNRQLYAEKPVIKAINSSAEAVIDILGYMRIKVVHTLGIDGGISRGSSFQDCYRTHEASYDLHLPHLKACCEKHGIEWIRL